MHAPDALPDVAVVVVSHDRFKDVWPGFFQLMARFWPDRPYPLYLIANHIDYADDRVTTIKVGDDLSWSQTLSSGLEKLPNRFVLLALEDFYLTAPVETARMTRLCAAMASTGAAYLRLFANPAPDRAHPDLKDVGLIEKGAAYRTSLQLALWDRKALLKLLRKDESPWEFEFKGSRRSDALEAPFLSVREGVAPMPYVQTVRRGRWLPETLDYFGSIGVTFDTSHRPVESRLYIWWQRTWLRKVLGFVWRMTFGRAAAMVRG